MSAKELDLATVRGYCAALANATHVFEAHWSSNLTEQMNYLSDTAFWIGEQLRFAHPRPSDPDYSAQLVYAQRMLAAIHAMERAWDTGHLAEESNVLSDIADHYGAEFGFEPLDDPLVPFPWEDLS